MSPRPLTQSEWNQLAAIRDRAVGEVMLPQDRINYYTILSDAGNDYGALAKTYPAPAATADT